MGHLVMALAKSYSRILGRGGGGGGGGGGGAKVRNGEFSLV